MSAVESIDGIVPGEIASPGGVEELSAALAAASRARRATVISGGGTKLQWGRPPARVDLLLSTRRLNRVIAHRHGDLTATIEAGARLADVNAELSRHGQWLPLDSAFADATIGGLVATNDSGPLRHRFGTPRDLLIGVTLALTDGRVIKAGGTVVKNVAGYDIGRLMCGSYGSLAAIATATFKLSPMLAASGTVGALYQDPETLARDALAVAAYQFELTACDVQMTPRPGAGSEFRLLLRVASSPAATEAQLATARALIGTATDVIRGTAESDLWRDQLGAPWWGDGTTVRLSWHPAALARVLALMQEVQQHSGAALTLTGRVATGAGLVRVDGAPDAQAAAIGRLRADARVGHVVALRAPHVVKQAIDVWGPPGDTAAVLHALKHTFDPAGILSPGRGPV